MKVIIFTSFLISFLVTITARCPTPTPSYGYFSGRYPVSGDARRTDSPSKSPSPSTFSQFPSRIGPISSSVPKFEQQDLASKKLRSNESFEKARKESQTINVDNPIFKGQKITIESSGPSKPIVFTGSRPSSPSSVPSLPNEPISSQATVSKSRPRSSAKNKSTPSNLNQRSTSQSKSNVQTQNIRNSAATNKSKRFRGNNSTKNPPAVSSSRSKSSTKISSVNPTQVQKVTKKEEKPPSKKEKKDETINEVEDLNPPTKKETNDEIIKTPEQTPESSDKPPEKSNSPGHKRKNEDEWEGPKTPEEDKPELYTVEENMYFIRAFTSDMTIIGKYKVGETIFYLLEKREKELDTADKAAIEYVINERLKKDPELIEALKKHNEKNKAGNKTPSTSNSTDEMPSYMVQLLSPSFSISQFETSPQTEADSNPPPNNTQIFNMNTSPLTIQHLLPLLFPHFHSLLQMDDEDDEDDTHPYSSGRSSFDRDTDTSIQSPIRQLNRPSVSIYSYTPPVSYHSNPSPVSYNSYPPPVSYHSYPSDPTPRRWGYSTYP